MIERDSNKLIPWFIAAVYSIKEMDQPILSQTRFDRVCEMLELNWESVNHINKKYITLEDVRKQDIRGEYPNLTQISIDHMKGAYLEATYTI